jgi:hypothetical protein
MQRRRVLALATIFAAVAASKSTAEDAITVPMASIGTACRILGQTGAPLGNMTTLQGVVVHGSRFKDDVGEHILQLQKIDDRASQDCVEISIKPHSTGFGEPHFALDLDSPEPRRPNPELSLPRLEYGQTYELRGYEIGGFEGVPSGAFWEGGGPSQIAGFRFTSHFVVVKAKKVSPIAFVPADFLGRNVLVHGKAVNIDGKAWLTGLGWKIKVLGTDMLGTNRWQEPFLNARVQIVGTIGKDPDANFLHIARRLKSPIQRDHLEDQVNQPVELRGEAMDSARHWYLRFNAQNVLVENMDKLVAARSIEHRQPIEVRGVLHKERLRDEISDDKNAKPQERYIVREASCSRVDDFLPIERINEPCPWSIGATPLDQTPREL